MLTFTTGEGLNAPSLSFSRPVMSNCTSGRKFISVVGMSGRWDRSGTRVKGLSPSIP